MGDKLLSHVEESDTTQKHIKIPAHIVLEKLGLDQYKNMTIDMYYSGYNKALELIINIPSKDRNGSYK